METVLSFGPPCTGFLESASAAPLTGDSGTDLCSQKVDKRYTPPPMSHTIQLANVPRRFSLTDIWAGTSEGLPHMSAIRVGRRQCAVALSPHVDTLQPASSGQKLHSLSSSADTLTWTHVRDSFPGL